MNLSAIRLCVSALPAARAFYSETLGLRLTNAGPGHCLFMSSGIRIVIEEAADDEHRALVGIFTGLSFEVPDIEKEYERMQGLGVHFIGPPELQGWGGWLATFADPSGNQLQLVQYPPLTVRPSST